MAGGLPAGKNRAWKQGRGERLGEKQDLCKLPDCLPGWRQTGKRPLQAETCTFPEIFCITVFFCLKICENHEKGGKSRCLFGVKYN